MKIFIYFLTRLLWDKFSLKSIKRDDWPSAIGRMNGKINEDPNFISSILWTDECSFKRSGYVNRKNFRFWGLEKHMILKKPLIERHLNVFVAFNTKNSFWLTFLKMNMYPPLRLMVNDMLQC